MVPDTTVLEKVKEQFITELKQELLKLTSHGEQTDVSLGQNAQPNVTIKWSKNQWEIDAGTGESPRSFKENIFKVANEKLAEKFSNLDINMELLTNLFPKATKTKRPKPNKNDIITVTKAEDKKLWKKQRQTYQEQLRQFRKNKKHNANAVKAYQANKRRLTLQWKRFKNSPEPDADELPTTTPEPTTVEPTTEEPTTTAEATTQEPSTTVEPTTREPTTTLEPTTTVVATTQDPTTTVEPTTPWTLPPVGVVEVFSYNSNLISNAADEPEPEPADAVENNTIELPDIIRVPLNSWEEDLGFGWSFENGFVSSFEKYEWNATTGDGHGAGSIDVTAPYNFQPDHEQYGQLFDYNSLWDEDLGARLIDGGFSEEWGHSLSPTMKVIAMEILKAGFAPTESNLLGGTTILYQTPHIHPQFLLSQLRSGGITEMDTDIIEVHNVTFGNNATDNIEYYWLVRMMLNGTGFDATEENIRAIIDLGHQQSKGEHPQWLTGILDGNTGIKVPRTLPDILEAMSNAGVSVLSWQSINEMQYLLDAGYDKLSWQSINKMRYLLNAGYDITESNVAAVDRFGNLDKLLEFMNRAGVSELSEGKIERAITLVEAGIAPTKKAIAALEAHENDESMFNSILDYMRRCTSIHGYMVERCENPDLTKGHLPADEVLEQFRDPETGIFYRDPETGEFIFPAEILNVGNGKIIDMFQDLNLVMEIASERPNYSVEFLMNVLQKIRNGDSFGAAHDLYVNDGNDVNDQGVHMDNVREACKGDEPQPLNVNGELPACDIYALLEGSVWRQLTKTHNDINVAIRTISDEEYSNIFVKSGLESYDSALKWFNDSFEIPKTDTQLELLFDEWTANLPV